MTEEQELAECIWQQRRLSGANVKRPITTYFDAESHAMDHCIGRDEKYTLRVAIALYNLATAGAVK